MSVNARTYTRVFTDSGKQIPMNARPNSGKNNVRVWLNGYII